MLNRKVVLNITTEFYLKATKDVLIGYHFSRIDNFETHIPRIASFWENQLGIARNKLDPPIALLKTHIPLMIKRGQMDRWKVLFFQTLEEFQNKDLISAENCEVWKNKVDLLKLQLEKTIFT